jgi:hypothetical protein
MLGTPPRCSRTRRLLVFAALAAIPALLSTPAPAASGLADPAWQRQRQLEWLAFATETPISPGPADWRKDDAHVALYSWRDVAWRGGQPEVFENGGLDFDLVASGGADNVWIVECGDVSQWPGGFSEFQAAFSSDLVTVTPTGAAFDVSFTSPTQGVVTLGWDGPLTADGDTQPLAGYRRFDNPFAQVEFGETRYEIADDAYSLVLDFATDSRRARQLKPQRR